MGRTLKKILSHTSALILGSGLSSVYALTDTDFTNTGVVISASSQFENNASNNSSVVIVQPKGLSVTKLADASGLSTPTEAGDSIAYEIVLDNTGILSITGIEINDSIIDDDAITLQSGDENGNNQIDANEIWTYSGRYEITQFDIDSFGDSDGLIDNTVIVTSNELDPIESSVSVPIEQSPELSIEKRVDQETLTAPALLSYTIAVKNTGNMTLDTLIVKDTLPNGNVVALENPVNDIGTVGKLDVGETWEYQQTYNVTQQIIDDGLDVVNNVSAYSSQTAGNPVEATVSSRIVTTPGLSVFKQVDLANISSPEVLNYTITVNNTGNVSLTDVGLNDLMPDGSLGSITGPVSDIGIQGVLDVGESWTYSSNYSVTQNTIDAGEILTSTVAVVSKETGSSEVSDSASTIINSLPAMQVTKTVDIPSIAEPTLLSYEIVVTNTGNTSLTDINVSDVLPDGTTAVLVGPLEDIGKANVIDVGERWTYTTSYQVSQAEIDAGLARVNQVQVLSKQTAATPNTQTAVTTISQSPAISVIKTADKATLEKPELISYTIEVKNEGNVSLSGIALYDTLPDGSAAVLNGPLADTGSNNLLDVGETWIYDSSYLVSQPEIDQGSVLVNTVTVNSNEAGSDVATASTALSQNPALSMVKSSEQSDFLAAGDKIEYQFAIQNSGNVVLQNVAMQDALVDLSTLVCEPAMPLSLQPAEQVSCSASRTITQDDVLNTRVVNIASVSGADVLDASITQNSNEHTLTMTRVAPVATDDIVVSEQSQVAVTLAGRLNDTDANGDIITSRTEFMEAAAQDTDNDGDTDYLNIIGQGIWQINNETGQVVFTPEAGFTADPDPVSYRITDATELQSQTANLVVDYPQMAPIAKDDYVVNLLVASVQNPTLVYVLNDNGHGEDSDSENDINSGSVNLVSSSAVDTDGDGYKDQLVVESEGTWQVDKANGSVSFQPLPDFLADPTPIAYTVSDINGLESNEAQITVDYPQNAPVAVDDLLFNQPLGETIRFSVLSNDTDAENNIDSSSVALIDPVSGERVTTLLVADGEWRVDTSTGQIDFVPADVLVSDPESVQYTVLDTTTLESNQATVTLDYEEPVTLQGFVWLDSNRDGVVNDDEQRKSGWTLRVRDVNNVVVAEVVTDENGAYRITGLKPAEYTIDFYNENDVYMDSQSTNGVVLAGETLNLPLAVNPGGVIYDSITRLPIAGVTLSIFNEQNQLLHADCLAPNQQAQTSTDDGLYAFNVAVGAHPSCTGAGSYAIQVTSAPEEYHPAFSTLIRQEGAQACGDVQLGCAVSGVFETAQLESQCTVDTLPGTNACEVQAQPDAPEESENTRYFVEFFMQSGAREVIFNHLPLDAVANDSQLLLSKTANNKTVSVGDIVRYTITVENTKAVPAVDIQIIDQPAAGLSFVEQALVLQRIGEDGQWGTDDDTSEPLGSANNDLLAIDAFDLAPDETVRVQYLMRVGTGVVSGDYANKAYADGNNGVASNLVSTSITVIPDPVIGAATLIGKVFNDRDADGTQDAADASGVRLTSAYFNGRGLSLDDLPGRLSAAQNPSENSVTVYMPITDQNSFSVSTKQGTRIQVDENGTVTEAHVGDKAKGFNSQDIRVCTARTQHLPHRKTGELLTHGEPVDVLKIVLSNVGLAEQGIPGARLATVTGLLIETDAYGRYSVPDVDAGSNTAGRNFVIKVDESTLPAQSTFTTENPAVLRILRNSLNKINFGVQIPEHDVFEGQHAVNCNSATHTQSTQHVEVSLGSVFFDTNEHTVRDDQRGIVQDIINKLSEYGGGHIIINSHTDSSGSALHNLALSQRRAETIRSLLEGALGEQLMDSISVEVDSNALQEQQR